MPTIHKSGTSEFKTDPNALKEFGIKTLIPRLGTLAGATHFMFDIRQLDPDKFSFPYHFHYNSEELMMLISGSMTLRTPDGLTILHAGDIVFFETGETGAHQFYKLNILIQKKSTSCRKEESMKRIRRSIIIQGRNI